MSDWLFACVFVVLATSLGWFAQLAATRDWPTTPITVGAEVVLMIWLWRRLERKDKDR